MGQSATDRIRHLYVRGYAAARQIRQQLRPSVTHHLQEDGQKGRVPDRYQSQALHPKQKEQRDILIRFHIRNHPHIRRHGHDGIHDPASTGTKVLRIIEKSDRHIPFGTRLSLYRRTDRPILWAQQ